MSKLLPIFVLIAIVVTTLFLFRSNLFPAQQSASEPVLPIKSQASPGISTTSDSTITQRVANLEKAVSFLLKQAGKTSSDIQPSSEIISTDPTFEQRLKLLETSVSDIKQKVGITPSQAPIVSKKAPVYIPLGNNFTTNDQNGIVLASFEALIDPAEYSGYTSMVLEVNMRMVQQSGTAYANLYNNTDSSDIQNSSVSTTRDQFGLLSSSGFSLPSGKKTYRLKAKSSNGVDTIIQEARIKVNF